MSAVASLRIILLVSASRLVLAPALAQQAPAVRTDAAKADEQVIIGVGSRTDNARIAGALHDGVGRCIYIEASKVS